MILPPRKSGCYYPIDVFWTLINLRMNVRFMLDDWWTGSGTKIEAIYSSDPWSQTTLVALLKLKIATKRP